MLNNPLPDLRPGQIWRRRDGTNTTLRENATRDGFTCSRDNIFIPALCATPEGYYLYGKHTPSIHDLLVLTSAPNEDMPAYVPTKDPDPENAPPYHWPYVTKDSGKREEMPTGSVRDSREGKGRFDLISPFALRRIAGVYERGSIKYADRNWEKGQKFSRCLDSALRHLNAFAMGWTDEDHASQAAWNILAILHFQETGRTDLDDMPHYQSGPTNA